MARPIDRQVVDQLVLEHLPAALRLATRLVGDPDVAEDVMQESLCRVLKRWKSYRGDAKFSTWMMQIVVNVVRERYRREHETDDFQPEAIVAHSPNPVELLAAVELRERIQEVINALPARQREVAHLKFGELLDPAEIAAVLQITEANVYSIIHLIRQRIANAIGADYAKQK